MKTWPRIIAPSLLLTTLLTPFAFAQTPAQSPTDKYGGFLDVQGTPADMFTVQKIAHRWWIITPEGHGTFIRTVSKVDTNNNNVDMNGSGAYQSYDAVYIQPADRPPTANLKEAAADSLPKDVINIHTGATLKNAGDALLLGSARFKPNFTYFWLDQPGVGGKIQWSYSTPQGWKPINNSGKPFHCEAKNPDNSYNLDVGGYLAPDPNGLGASPNKAANKITWFDLPTTGFPPDFAPILLPNDPTPRYYLKALVTQPFTTPPILNQTFERPIFDETIQRKYGPGDWSAHWAQATTERLKNWGYNAVGMYSGTYVTMAAFRLGDHRLSDEPTCVLGGGAIKDPRYHVKNVYSGAIFPPGSGRTGWHGVQPDAFDPNFETAYAEQMAKELPRLSKWSWSLITEEADYMFGFDNQTHDHMAYVILAQNPCHLTDPDEKISYHDPKLYAKYALRDFLRDRYHPPGDAPAPVTVDTKIPARPYADHPQAAELAALENLNRAWGTRYTTWSTSAGDLEKGTNAWGKGSGFMDENGAAVLAPGARGADFNKNFTKPQFPAIRKDLDDFLALSAARYGKSLAKACSQGKHPPLILPLYEGPDLVYKAIAPYVDGFWVSCSANPAGDALRIYNAGHKPLIVADYVSANADSPLTFKSTIEKIAFDPAKNRTLLYGPNIHWIFRPALFLQFPGNEALAHAAASRGLALYPRPDSAHWNTLEIPGDYTAFLKPGSLITTCGDYPTIEPMPPTQEDRARQMIDLYRSVLNLKGDDGNYCVIGFEHWCLNDDGPYNGSEHNNRGIATLLDNAYDGKEARRSPATDPQSHPCGGEEADYGNLMGPLSDYLRSIPQNIIKK